jgi:WD40-like Beta Propeller Repeat
MYHTRGGAGVQVTKGKPKPDSKPDDHVNAIGAVASPDGKHLYFAKRNKLFNAYNNLQFPLSQIVRRDRLTGEEDTITEAQGSAFRPALSPDGKNLVYGTKVDNQTGLPIRDLTSGEERWLKLPVQRDEQESRYTRDLIPGYAFTPDGRSVLAAYEGKIHRIDVQTGEDQVVRFSARVSKSVGSRLNFPARVDDGPGAPHSRPLSLAGRQVTGVLGAHSPLCHGLACWGAATPFPGRCAGVSAGLVAGWQCDGTDRRTHLSVIGKTAYFPRDPEGAEEILLRPDGRWVLARVTNQLYLLALPQLGGEAPKIVVQEPSVPLKKLTDIGADYAAWTDGGKTITWAIGSSFFRLGFDSIVFEPLKTDEDEKEGDKDKDKDKDKSNAEKKGLKPKSEEIAVVIERPRHRPQGSTVLRGAKIITMRGDEVIDDGEILVTDHRIVAVARRGALELPPRAKVRHRLPVGRRGRGRCGPVQEVLSNEHREILPDRQSTPTPVDGRSVSEKRGHAHHRGGTGPQAEPQPRDRRIQRQRAQPAGRPHLRRRRRAVRPDGYLLHPHAPCRLRRPIWRDRLFHINPDPRRPQDSPIRPAPKPLPRLWRWGEKGSR